MILAHRYTLVVWLAAILLFLFLASCPPAVGYQVKEFRWDASDFPIQYWIDPEIEVGGEWVISASSPFQHDLLEFLSRWQTDTLPR